MKIQVTVLTMVMAQCFWTSSYAAEVSDVSELPTEVPEVIETVGTLEPQDSELNSSWAPHWGSLIGLWHLNDSPRSRTATDSSASQESGGRLKSGVSLGASGHLMGAASFDGEKGFIETPLLSTATTNVTMMAWFKSNDFAQAGQMIFFNGSEDGANGYGVALNRENETSGELRILYGGVLWYDTGAYVTDNNWHHFALSIRSDGHPDLYLDGALVFSGYSSSPNAPSRYANIGRNDYVLNHASNPRYFNGLIDEVAFWSTDLSTADIQLIYSHQK